MVKAGVYKDEEGNEHCVAVKFLKPVPENEMRSSLRNELNVLAGVPPHPNIVKFYFVQFSGSEDGDGANDADFIVEELMHTNLSNLIHNDSDESWPMVEHTYGNLLRIFLDIIAGIQHLHAHNVVHYDLKPENILLDRQLTAKLADFGCSRFRAKSYVTAVFAGTMAYMAPECLLAGFYNTLHVDATRSDIFSLGIVMWECLTGQRPTDPRGTDGFHMGRSGAAMQEETSDSSGDIGAQWDTRTQSSILSVATSDGSRDNSPQLSDDALNSANTAASGNLPRHMHKDSFEYLENLRLQLDDRYPQELRELVHKCLSFEYNKRPTCEEVTQCLNAMSSSGWVDRLLPT